jgi:hypothetical protein
MSWWPHREGRIGGGRRNHLTYLRDGPVATSLGGLPRTILRSKIRPLLSTAGTTPDAAVGQTTPRVVSQALHVDWGAALATIEDEGTPASEVDRTPASDAGEDIAAVGARGTGVAQATAHHDGPTTGHAAARTTCRRSATGCRSPSGRRSATCRRNAACRRRATGRRYAACRCNTTGRRSATCRRNATGHRRTTRRHGAPATGSARLRAASDGGSAGRSLRTTIDEQGLQLAVRRIEQPTVAAG